MFFVDTMAEVGKFMDSGGTVLWAIVILLFVMWTLIFERMWYLRSSVSIDVQGALDVWENRKERKSKHAHQIREKLIMQGLDPTPSSPDEMAAYMKKEYNLWGNVIAKAGIKVDN